MRSIAWADSTRSSTTLDDAWTGLAGDQRARSLQADGSLGVPRHSLFLSSSMHWSGSADVDTVNLAGGDGRRSYEDSKLFLTTLAMAVGRIVPTAMAHAIDPRWVPRAWEARGPPTTLRR